MTGPRQMTGSVSWGSSRFVDIIWMPVRSPKEAHALPGLEVKHGENTAISRYVWLPIEWEGDKPIIRWQKEWKIK